jgi:hypothetical protein
MLERLEREDLGDTPFEEDRLLLLADMRLRAGHRDEAPATYGQILEKYPTGAAAAALAKQVPRSDRVIAGDRTSKLSERVGEKRFRPRTPPKAGW